MARFAAAAPTGVAVQELEVLVRTALFKPAAALIGDLLQGAADRVDAQYQSKPGEERKGREPLQVQCLFGTFTKLALHAGPLGPHVGQAQQLCSLTRDHDQVDPVR